jgi:hypothetical protein
MAEEALEALERGLKHLLLDKEARLLEGVPEDRQLLYRRIVRGSLTRVLRDAIPRTRDLLGEEITRSLLARFLEEAPPTTRLYRQLPLQLAAWARDLEDPPHPAFGELVHWEVTEQEVAAAEDSEPRELPLRPSDEAHVELHPATRLVASVHAVQAVKSGATEWPKASATPNFLVLYRANEQVRWVAVDAAVAKTLLYAAQGHTLGEIFTALEAEPGEGVDRGFVRSWLVNLQRRGALLGFPPQGSSS